MMAKISRYIYHRTAREIAGTCHLCEDDLCQDTERPVMW